MTDIPSLVKTCRLAAAANKEMGRDATADVLKEAADALESLVKRTDVAEADMQMARDFLAKSGMQAYWSTETDLAKVISAARTAGAESMREAASKAEKSSIIHEAAPVSREAWDNLRAEIDGYIDPDNPNHTMYREIGIAIVKSWPRIRALITNGGR